MDYVGNCSVDLDLPNIIVAPDSRQISATLLVSTEDYRSLLLVYKDHSVRVIVMSAYANNSVVWTWRNETSKLYTPQSTKELLDLHTCSGALFDSQISNTTSFHLKCFARYGKSYASSKVAQILLPFAVNSSSSGEIEVDDSRSFHPSRS